MAKLANGNILPNFISFYPSQYKFSINTTSEGDQGTYTIALRAVYVNHDA